MSSVFLFFSGPSWSVQCIGWSPKFQECGSGVRNIAFILEICFVITLHCTNKNPETVTISGFLYSCCTQFSQLLLQCLLFFHRMFVHRTDSLLITNSVFADNGWGIFLKQNLLINITNSKFIALTNNYGNPSQCASASVSTNCRPADISDCRYFPFHCMLFHLCPCLPAIDLLVFLSTN